MTKRSDSPVEGDAASDETGFSGNNSCSGNSDGEVTSAEVSLNATSASSASVPSPGQDHANAGLQIQTMTEAIRTFSDDVADDVTYSDHSSPVTQGTKVISHEPTQEIQSIMQTLQTCTEKYLSDNIKFEPI